MAIDTIYTIAGGAWFQDTLNGVASFLDSRAGDALIAMASRRVSHCRRCNLYPDP
ncbi:conjugal transfer mating pair stabilization protein TraG [Escherichia coli]|uniref:Conjugal transfer mating pair stabilization protein TraG n=1 Tax=Escherichia coli TaxID=562 RepID=A0A376TVE3_ECOLX|nr:conjugal transfer mating pair stabilization protein TraG [Escherichia coli]